MAQPMKPVPNSPTATGDGLESVEYRVCDINVAPSEGVTEPRPEGSDHGPAGPPKPMNAREGRSRKINYLPLRLQRSAERDVLSSAFVVALPAGRGSVSLRCYMLSIFKPRSVKQLLA